jgi:hypothetical protein
MLLVGESSEVFNCFTLNFLPAAIQSHGLQHIHGLLYVYYAVSNAV